MTHRQHLCVFACLLFAVLFFPAAGSGQISPTLPPPNLLSPQSDAGMDPDHGTLDWEDIDGATEYEVQIGLECELGLVMRSTESTLDYNGLVVDQLYYWRVRTKNADGVWGRYSSCWRFSTHQNCPAPPLNVQWHGGGL